MYLIFEVRKKDINIVIMWFEEKFSTIQYFDEEKL